MYIVFIMPKSIPHSRDFIEAAFMSAASMDDLVSTLECCRATCYNYARRYGLVLPPPRPRGGRRSPRSWGMRSVRRD